MPKSTFYNLPIEKQKKVIKAGKKEFSKWNINKASINRIIKNAKISKGSFYQYFVDKDEFYWYIVELVIKDNITLYDQLLEDNDGDIFLVEEIQLKELFKLFANESYQGLIRNVFLYSASKIKQNLYHHDELNFNVMYQIFLSRTNNHYNITSEEDFNAFFDMLRTLSHACIIGVVSNAYSENYALELYNKQINLIKRGLEN